MTSVSSDNKIFIEWMWADASILPIPGMNSLASLNPLRWSAETEENIINELQNSNDDRPVKLRVCGESNVHYFESTISAIEWIKQSDELIEKPSGSIITSFLGTTGVIFSAPLLALFCRVNSNQKWTKRHIFKAMSFARRTTKLPLTIAKKQTYHSSIPSNDSINREYVSWDDFNNSKAKELALFIPPATVLLNERLESVTINNKDWIRYEDNVIKTNDYWTVYVRDIEKKAIVVFRGGDGGLNDSKFHYGSPARPFILGLDENVIPDIPLYIFSHLKDKDYKVSIIGYSQGGIPALGCALQVMKEDYIEQCTLLNCAFLFWPAWFNVLLKDEWWKNSKMDHPEWAKFDNWVIQNDPISEGMPSGQYKAPLGPGITKILPTITTGVNVLENHALKHFIK